MLYKGLRASISSSELKLLLSESSWTFLFFWKLDFERDPISVTVPVDLDANRVWQYSDLYKVFLYSSPFTCAKNIPKELDTLITREGSLKSSLCDITKQNIHKESSFLRVCKVQFQLLNSAKCSARYAEHFRLFICPKRSQETTRIP